MNEPVPHCEDEGSGWAALARVASPATRGPSTAASQLGFDRRGVR